MWPAKSDDKNPTILIAEDERAIRELLSHSLGQNGFTVLVAEDAEEALKIAATHEGSIDLLLTNVQMPGMNGVDLAREVRRRHPEMLVLLVSGYADGIAILQVGWYFLKKPFRPSAVVAKVNEVLGKPPSTAVERAE